MRHGPSFAICENPTFKPFKTLASLSETVGKADAAGADEDAAGADEDAAGADEDAAGADEDAAGADEDAAGADEHPANSPNTIVTASNTHRILVFFIISSIIFYFYLVK
jgi:hypothetical protein